MRLSTQLYFLAWTPPAFISLFILLESARGLAARHAGVGAARGPWRGLAAPPRPAGRSRLARADDPDDHKLLVGTLDLSFLCQDMVPTQSFGTVQSRRTLHPSNDLWKTGPMLAGARGLPQRLALS